MGVQVFLMKVLVTGATGAIGQILVKRLQEKGCHVRIFARHGSDVSHFSGETDIFRGNIASEKDLCNSCEGIDVIFHLAAKLHINNPLPCEEKEIFQINLDSTRLLCRAAWKKGVGRLIFFSTVNVYGISGKGHVFNENSVPNPLTAYAESKLKAEKHVLGLSHPLTGLKAGIVLRYSAVYGQNMKGNYSSLLRLAEKNFRILPGNLRNRRTLVNEEDAVEAAITAAFHPDTAGRIFNITDGTFHTLQAVYISMINHGINSGLHDCSARKKQIIRVPLSVLRPVLVILDHIAVLLARRAPFIHALNKFTEDMAVDGSLFIRTTGFKPEYILSGWKKRGIR